MTALDKGLIDRTSNVEGSRPMESSPLSWPIEGKCIHNVILGCRIEIKVQYVSNLPAENMSRAQKSINESDHLNSRSLPPTSSDSEFSCKMCGKRKSSIR